MKASPEFPVVSNIPTCSVAPTTDRCIIGAAPAIIGASD